MGTNMSQLFEPLQLGELRLANRVVMAPVTKRETPAGDAKCAKSDRKPHTSSWRLPDGSLKAATC